MENKTPESLGEALPAKIEWVKNTVIPAYEECGVGGVFALAMIRASVVGVERALLSGDVVKMIIAYKDLDEIKL